MISATLHGLAGARVGGRYELVTELSGDADARYEAVDLDGSRCLVTLLRDSSEAEGLQSGVVEVGTDAGLGCAYLVEPLEPEPTDELRPGTVFAGKYRVVARLGGGGMGTVYEATTEAGERVALKLIRGDRGSLHDKRRLVREARAAAKVESRHVTRVFASDVDGETSTPFLVMELLTGEDLATLLAREGPLVPAVAARIGVQACRGLEDARREGLVHRDVKPANIFLHKDDGAVTVKVCDFGIVKDVVFGQEETSLTRTGALVGTPAYMAPEQAKDATGVDHRADVWSVAASIYEALAGASPWASSKSVGEVLVRLETQDVPPLADVAPWLDPALCAAVHRALARRPEKRFGTAGQLADALEPFASVEPLLPEQLRRVARGARAAAPRDLPRPPEPRRRFRPVIAAVATAVVVTATAAMAISLRSRGSDDPPAEPASVIDLSKREAPVDADDIEPRLVKAGYQVHSRNRSASSHIRTWTWAVSDDPCGGTVIFVHHDNDALAEVTADAFGNNTPGRVFRTGRRVLYVSLMRETKGELDGYCTDPVADVLTR